MSQDLDQDWKLVRNDSLQQSPLSCEECLRQRVILYTRLDRDIRILSFIHLFDPTDKSFYYFISNEAGFEQTVNLDFKAKIWEKRVESQRSKLLKLESDMSDVLNQLSLRQILRSQSGSQKEQRNKMLNIMCTMSVIALKELVYTGLVILNSKGCFKEFEKLKRERDDFFLKNQSQIIKTIYEGLSHLHRNVFYIPQLRKDYFVRDSEKRESEEQVLLQESKQLVKRLKKAHSERSGVLTLTSPHDVTTELAKLLGEVKKLKKDTPVTYQDLEAQNMEEFSSRIAQVLSQVMGTSAASSTLGASAATTTLGTTASSIAISTDAMPMQPARLFQTPDTTPQPPASTKTKKSKSLTPEEQQELLEEVTQIKQILGGRPAPLDPPIVSSDRQGRTQRNWVEATPQVNPRIRPVTTATPLFGENQGAVSRPAVRFDPTSFARTPASRKPVLETVVETSGSGKTLTQQDINLDTHFDNPPPSEKRNSAPLKLKDLQEQLQQLRLGPTVASTPLRTPKPFKGVIEPPTPIVRPTGTIPKPGVNRTFLDDNYQPKVAQPGTETKKETTANSQSSTGQFNPVGASTHATERVQVSDSSDDSEEEECVQRTQYQTALDTVINNPAMMGSLGDNPSLAQFNTVTHGFPDTTSYVEIEHPPEMGLGQLLSVVRELFGGDTNRAALMERALLSWVRVKAR